MKKRSAATKKKARTTKTKVAPVKAPKRKPRERSRVISPLPIPDQVSTEFHEVDENHIPARAWEIFLEELRERGHIKDTCKVVGIKRITVYKHAERDEDFRKAMKEAHQMGLSSLEDEAVRRAKGYKKPVFFKGERVDEVEEYSDRMIELILRQRHPDYRKSLASDEAGIAGQNGNGGVLVVPAPLDTDDWEAAAVAMQKKLREEVRE